MQIEKIYLNKDNLIKIKQIDDEFFKEDITPLDWYIERYTSKHTGYIIKDNDKIIGYLVAVPIKKEAYNAIINGVIINDIHLNPDMFVEKSRYHYIIAFVLLDEYRHKGLGTSLIKSVIKHVEKGKYCTLTVSKEGASLSKKFMKLKQQLNDEVAVFEIKL